MGYKINRFNKASASYQKVETWDTRFGVSRRIVKRHSDGKFSDNLSANQVARGA